MPFGMDGFCAIILCLGLLFQFKCLARFRDDDVLEAFLAQLALVEFQGIGVAVDEESSLYLAWVLAFQVVDKLGIVAVTAEGIDRVDVGHHAVLGAEDGYDFRSWVFQELGAKGGWRAIADGEDAVLWVVDAVG